VNICPIRTEADHRAVLADISALVASDPALGTSKGDRLDILATLVRAYEARHVPMEAPDPVEAIRFRMEHSGLTVKDLEPIIGRPIASTKS
jgi:HTH-type transcriptional regulator/antitoxin HigA